MNPFATQPYQKKDRIFTEMFQRRKRNNPSLATDSTDRIQKQVFLHPS